MIGGEIDVKVGCNGQWLQEARRSATWPHLANRFDCCKLAPAMQVAGEAMTAAAAAVTSGPTHTIPNIPKFTRGTAETSLACGRWTTRPHMQASTSRRMMWGSQSKWCCAHNPPGIQSGCITSCRRASSYGCEPRWGRLTQPSRDSSLPYRLWMRSKSISRCNQDQGPWRARSRDASELTGDE